MFSINKFVFILCTVFICSCQPGNEDRLTESFGESKSEGEIASCPCSDLEKNVEGELERNGEPYTGNCFLNYEDSDAKYIEKQVVNGLINGTIKYFDKDGKVIFEEKFEKGAHQLDLEIENIRCDCAELTKHKKDQKYYYKGQAFKGVCFNKFPAIDQPYIEIAYRGGLRDGYTNYYSKIGDLLYAEKYEKGVLLKVIYPKK